MSTNQEEATKVPASADTKRSPKIGEHVIFTDPKGNDFDALITVDWGHENRLVNLVYVSGDESRQDSYGRQIERSTSLMHVSRSNVHGFYWRFPDEKKNPYQAPVSQ